MKNANPPNKKAPSKAKREGHCAAMLGRRWGRNWFNARPHPGLLPREKEQRSQLFAANPRLDRFKRLELSSSEPGDVLSLGRVALLAIAQRSVTVNYPVNSRNQKRANVLKLNMKTVGDWLKVKRLEKNLTRSHVAAKMGIATSLVCAWENDTQQPDNQQLRMLASVLDFDTKVFKTPISILPKR